MLGLRRSERVTRIEHDGTLVALVEATWILEAGGEERAAGFSYTAPVAVATEGGPRLRIYDYVMLARLGSVLVTILLILWAIAATNKPGARRRCDE